MILEKGGKKSWWGFFFPTMNLILKSWTSTLALQRKCFKEHLSQYILKKEEIEIRGVSNLFRCVELHGLKCSSLLEEKFKKKKIQLLQQFIL